MFQIAPHPNLHSSASLTKVFIALFTRSMPPSFPILFWLSAGQLDKLWFKLFTLLAYLPMFEMFIKMSQLYLLAPRCPGWVFMTSITESITPTCPAFTWLFAVNYSFICSFICLNGDSNLMVLFNVMFPRAMNPHSHMVSSLLWTLIAFTIFSMAPSSPALVWLSAKLKLKT